MTSVQVFRHGNSTRSFICSGHTGYADAGEDIVCAGISAIVVNTINCLQDLLKEEIEVSADEETGEIICNFMDTPGDRAEFLVECMIHGFDWIIRQYGNEYLNYEIKEV